MTKQYDKEFKENAVQYRYDHPELTVKECAKNMGVPYDTYHLQEQGRLRIQGIWELLFG